MRAGVVNNSVHAVLTRLDAAGRLLIGEFQEGFELLLGQDLKT